MWFVIIMVVVIALVVGPIMMMRPSPAQKNKERMRAIAYAKGIRFTIKNLPQQATEMEKPIPVPVYFFVPTKHRLPDDWLLLRTGNEHEIHFLGSWAWQGKGRATAAELVVLNEYLPRVPESIRAVSVGNQGVCVYWQEQGGDEVLQQVIALLEALNATQN